jgi:hypothetical protein
LPAEARRLLFFARRLARDRNAEAHASTAICSIVTKEQDAMLNTEKPQQSRSEMI